MKLAVYIIFFSFALSGQNENRKWYFGANTGLDFMTTPPTLINTSAMNVAEGCSSVANGAGSLLFYTDGQTVWNNLHNPMPNGTGLLGNTSTTQGALILKQPGQQKIYYVFTLDDIYAGPGVDGLRYSVVDLNLASGLGDVTTKNVLLHTPSTEKMCAVRHCNGSDFWVLTHDWGTNDFRAYLLTAAGLNTVAVLSPVGPVNSGADNVARGQMKFSPSGKKLAFVSRGLNNCVIFDFNSGTGMLSNPFNLSTSLFEPYGCEFSPDGSKLYACGGNQTPFLSQWDLCAGSPTAVISSETPLPTNGYGNFGMQSGPDGKIYIAFTTATCGVINNPNGLGLACNYSINGQSMWPHISNLCFPAFASGDFRQQPAPFSYTVQCQKVFFSGISSISSIQNTCSDVSYTSTSQSWDFGDLGSGSANYSTLLNPEHIYSAPGTYTAQMVMVYPCYKDTLRQVINITVASPTFALSGQTSICKNNPVVLTANNASYTYLWEMGYSATATPVFSASGLSVTTTPTATSFFTVTATNTITGCSFTKVQALSVNSCLSLSNNTTNNNVRLFPNPVTSFLTIESEQNELEIKILNQLGEVVFEVVKLKNRSELDLRNLRDGLYYIQVRTSNALVTTNFIKGNN